MARFVSVILTVPRISDDVSDATFDGVIDVVKEMLKGLCPDGQEPLVSYGESRDDVARTVAAWITK